MIENLERLSIADIESDFGPHETIAEFRRARAGRGRGVAAAAARAVVEEVDAGSGHDRAGRRGGRLRRR